jgi:hypothetical protein
MKRDPALRGTMALPRLDRVWPTTIDFPLSSGNRLTDISSIRRTRRVRCFLIGGVNWKGIAALLNTNRGLLSRSAATLVLAPLAGHNSAQSALEGSL